MRAPLLGTAAAAVALAASLTTIAQPAGATEPGPSAAPAAGPCNGAWISDLNAGDNIRNHQYPYKAGGGIRLQTRDCGPGRDMESRAAMLIYTPLRAGTDAVVGIHGRNGDEYCRIAAGGRYCTTPPITGPADRIYAAVRRYLGNGVWDPYASGEWNRP